MQLALNIVSLPALYIMCICDSCVTLHVDVNSQTTPLYVHIHSCTRRWYVWTVKFNTWNESMAYRLHVCSFSLALTAFCAQWNLCHFDTQNLVTYYSIAVYTWSGNHAWPLSLCSSLIIRIMLLVCECVYIVHTIRASIKGRWRRACNLNYRYNYCYVTSSLDIIAIYRFIASLF